jgi:hypothetical protein
MLPSNYVYGMGRGDKFDGRKMGLASNTFDSALASMPDFLQYDHDLYSFFHDLYFFCHDLYFFFHYSYSFFHDYYYSVSSMSLWIAVDFVFLYYDLVSSRKLPVFVWKQSSREAKNSKCEV